ncbi:MAG: VacB/RNase II family 3'-5' exoribonuclease [Thermotogae bacterium]|nr:VacB/RNase II family 3'-5' exoribonuclease [Thermotogota bacterium]
MEKIESIENEVLELLKRAKKPRLTISQIARAFKLSKKRTRRILFRLIERGEVIRFGKRYSHVSRAGRITRGVIQLRRAGFGFVKAEDGEIFIPAWATGDALSGDEVEVLVFPEKKGSLPEGKVLRILKHGTLFVGGTYIGQGLVLTDDPKLGTVRVLRRKKLQPKRGQRVILKRKNGEWEIFEINPDDYRLIELKYSLPSRFPKNVLKETEKLAPIEDAKRFDLKDDFTITIDPKTAKDYDDAIYVERYSKGWLLRVHIADVAYWVPKGSAMDREAQRRGTSVYLIDRVIPMLPPKVSDDLASLLPGRPKYTFTVEVKIGFDGRVHTKSARFYRSVIRSWARLTYEDAERLLNDEEPHDKETKIYRKAIAGVRRTLKEASNLAEVLRHKREQRGSIDFDLPEAEFLMEDGKVIMVSPKERLWSHKIIEELMITANMVVATYMQRREWPVLYRVHDRPDPKKIKRFITLAERLLGKRFSHRKITPKLLALILQEFKGKPEETLMNHLLLRSMARAEYSPMNIGHFGLALKNYLHFTSPIRRYPDLIAHRQLWQLISGGRSLYEEEELEKLGRYLSERERLAEDAEWELWRLKIYEFMQDKIGQVYEGIVVGLSSESLFVQITEHLAEGYVPFAHIQGRVVPLLENYSLMIFRKGERKRISLGDRLKVKILNVNKYAKDMVLDLVED